MYGEHYSWMGIGMWLFWIVLLAIIIVIVKAVTANATVPPSKEEPMEILKSRYARGDIDDEEFQRRKSELENKHGEK
jgi:putative membrane protein